MKNIETVNHAPIAIGAGSSPGGGAKAAVMRLFSFPILMIAAYILFSAKLDRFYIGSAKDFDARFEKHQTHYFGHEKFTSKADDWEIFIVIDCKTENQARQIEAHIKKMKSKTYIQNLKKYPEMIQHLLEKYRDC